MKAVFLPFKIVLSTEGQNISIQKINSSTYLTFTGAKWKKVDGVKHYLQYDKASALGSNTHSIMLYIDHGYKLCIFKK